MTRHCMRSYSLLAIKTCHRRGAHAMGGMAAQIPIKDDPAKNAALAKVREDKTREATDGHDGTWVAHPGLVAIAMEEFDKAMPRPTRSINCAKTSRSKPQTCSNCRPAPLPKKGMRTNISVGIQYMANWLAAMAACPSTTSWKMRPPPKFPAPRSGSGCIIPDGVLETAAKSPPTFSVGAKGRDAKIRNGGGPPLRQANIEKAADLFDDIIADDTLDEFLTLRAYEQLDWLISIRTTLTTCPT
jgi:malate synthase